MWCLLVGTVMVFAIRGAGVVDCGFFNDRRRVAVRQAYGLQARWCRGGIRVIGIETRTTDVWKVLCERGLCRRVFVWRLGLGIIVVGLVFVVWRGRVLRLEAGIFVGFVG